MGLLRSIFAALGVFALLLAIFVGAVLWTGAYDVAADSGEGFIERIAQFTREHSVGWHDASVYPPPLDNPYMIAAGAAYYDHMCSGCHLAPGMKTDAMRQGMNPLPSPLAERRPLEPAADFWIVKHGIKMTGMPAWGGAYSNEVLWELVAFLQKLPAMTPARYRWLVAEGRPEIARDGKAPDPAFWAAGGAAWGPD